MTPDNLEAKTIGCLPDQVLLNIFTSVDPYDDLESIRLVCRRWYFVAGKAIGIMKRAFLRCDQFRWKLYGHTDLLTPRYSHCSCFHEGTKSMFVFGGSTASYTSSRKWNRVVIRSSPFPSPKALATLIPYEGYLLLYGGFSKSSPELIRRTSKFFDELHLFNVAEQRWIELVSENEGPKLAGHSAAIVGDSMIVFGGLFGESSSNEVHVFDIRNCRWWTPDILNKCLPRARCNHSQALIDDNHLLIVGGSVVSGTPLNDAWLLTFDLTKERGWTWSQIKIVNQEILARQLGSHAACTVGQNMVVLGFKKDASVGSKRVKPSPSRATYSSAGDALERKFVQKSNVALKSRYSLKSGNHFIANESRDAALSRHGMQKVSDGKYAPEEPCSSSSSSTSSSAFSENLADQSRSLLKQNNFRLDLESMCPHLCVYVLDISAATSQGVASERLPAQRSDRHCGSNKTLTLHLRSDLIWEGTPFDHNVKIDRQEQRLVLEEKYEDCELDEIGSELPTQQPRYILISYERVHDDGRRSYPMCLVFYSPIGSSPEMQMMYAGSRNSLCQECQLNKNIEIRDAEELTREFLDAKMTF